MGTCSDCGKPTEYNKERCVECFKKYEHLKKLIKFDYDMIKGRLAETLIELLFLRLGYKVYRYGMENTVPEIMDKLKRDSGDVARRIRRMPDFVVEKNSKFYFVEAKFRGGEWFTKEDSSLHDDYPYKNCYFVIVSKNHIKCISYNEIQDGKKISPEDKNYLFSKKEFDFSESDREIIIQFCDFATKFFQNV